MIVYAEGEEPQVWEPGDELPCGCRFNNPQIIQIFGQHVGGGRGHTCVHGLHWVFTVEVLTQFQFKIKKGIQP